MDLNRGNSIAMMLCSIASILSCMSVLGAFVLFPDMLRKTTKKIIFYLVISNLLNAVGSIVGEPEDKSGACWFEGVVTNVFTLSTVMWTTVICYAIYSMSRWGIPAYVNGTHHVICWGVPVLVTLLPLINATYGAPGGMGWCWIVPNSQTPSWGLMFWYWMSFYAIVWGGLGSTVVLLGISYWNLHLVDEDSKYGVQMALSKLRLYPLIVLISWGTPCFYDNISGMNSYASDYPGAAALANAAVVLPCLQGVMTAWAFWATNNDIREFTWTFITTGDLESVINGRISSKSIDCSESSTHHSVSFSFKSTSRSSFKRGRTSSHVVVVGSRQASESAMRRSQSTSFYKTSTRIGAADSRRMGTDMSPSRPVTGGPAAATDLSSHILGNSLTRPLTGSSQHLSSAPWQSRYSNMSGKTSVTTTTTTTSASNASISGSSASFSYGGNSRTTSVSADNNRTSTASIAIWELPKFDKQQEDIINENRDIHSPKDSSGKLSMNGLELNEFMEMLDSP